MKKNLKKATALLAVCGSVVAAPVATFLTSPAAVFAEEAAGGAAGSGDSGDQSTGTEDGKGPSSEFGSDPKEPSGDTDQKEPSGDTDQKEPSGGTEQKDPSGGTEQKDPSGDTDQKDPSGGTEQKDPSGETTAPSLNAAPQLTEGNGAVYVPGSGQGLTFRSTASFGSFTGVLVDGNKVSEDNYTKREGSIIIELKPAYLASLPAGDHTVTIESTEGNTTAGFKVAAADDANAYTAATPKTGDATSIAVPAVTLAAAAAAAVFFVARRAKKN